MANVKATDLIDFTRASKGHALAKVSYGEELVDVANTASSWTVYGSNTVAQNGDAVEITYVDNSNGAYEYLRQIDGTTEDLKGSKLYRLSFSAKTNQGSVRFQLYDTSQPIQDVYVTNTDYQEFAVNFVSDGSGHLIKLNDMGAGEVFSIKNISVKEVLFNQPDGTLQLFEHPNNIPRIEYDADGNLLGLLIEEARTNLITDSQDFSASSWTKTNTATLALDSVGPDGQANSAVNLVDSGATGTGVVLLFDTVTVETSSTYTASVYAKKNGLSDILLYHGNFTTPSDGGYYFNLEDGTITAGGSSGTATIEEVGNGWYRCAITFTTDAADTSGAIRMYVTDGTNITVDLDGTSSALIYGAQFEKGSFPTSYIKTQGSTVSRAADVASIDVDQFGYNQSEGTLFVDYSGLGGAAAARYVVGLSDGSTTSYIGISPSRYQGSTFSKQFTSESEAKMAAVYKASDYAISIEGASVLTVSSGAVPTGITLMTIGDLEPSTNRRFNCHIKSITYTPKRLSNAKLQELTS